MASDDRPLAILVTEHATRETVIAELKSRFPGGNGRDARDRIYQNGIIMLRPSGRTDAIGCRIGVHEALRLGAGIGYVLPNISDLDPVG